MCVELLHPALSIEIVDSLFLTKLSFELIKDINVEFRGFQSTVDCLEIKIRTSRTWNARECNFSHTLDFTQLYYFL